MQIALASLNVFGISAAASKLPEQVKISAHKRPKISARPAGAPTRHLDPCADRNAPGARGHLLVARFSGPPWKPAQSIGRAVRYAQTVVSLGNVSVARVGRRSLYAPCIRASK